MLKNKFIFIGNKKANKQYVNAEIQYGKINDCIPGIDYNVCYYSAVDAEDLSSTDLYKYAELPTFLTPEEIGRALTHINVYKQLLESDLEYIYILEANCTVDEGYFSYNFFLDVERVFQESSTPKIILLQEWCNGKKTGIMLGNCELIKARDCYGTCGYIINRQAAENILKLQEPLKFEIDIYKYYYWLQLAEIYTLDKNIVVSLSNEKIYGNHNRFNGVIVSAVEKKLRYRKYKLEFRKLNARGKFKACTRRVDKVIHNLF